jgi:hypothetical protein
LPVSRRGDPVATQQFRGFDAFLIVVGLLLLAAAGVVGLSVGGENQIVTAGVFVGFGTAAGLSFVAAAIIYLADKDRKP